MILGFSTGSLAKGDFKRALSMLKMHNVDAVKLSALRESELPELLNALEDLDLTAYEHISLHAPSKLDKISEQKLVSLLQPLPYPVVVHPDIIKTSEHWKILGPKLLIENMDKRKPIGRTSNELTELFSLLPEARLCLDVGHSKQIDPSLYETHKILRQHGHRLAEIHLSEVNSASGHERLNRAAIDDFKSLARSVGPNIPVILESPVSTEEIGRELDSAREVFGLREMVGGAICS